MNGEASGIKTTKEKTENKKEKKDKNKKKKKKRNLDTNGTDEPKRKKQRKLKKKKSSQNNVVPIELQEEQDELRLDKKLNGQSDKYSFLDLDLDQSLNDARLIASRGSRGSRGSRNNNNGAAGSGAPKGTRDHQEAILERLRSQREDAREEEERRMRYEMAVANANENDGINSVINDINDVNDAQNDLRLQLSLNRMTKLAQTKINIGNDGKAHLSKFLKLKEENANENGNVNVNNGEGKGKGQRKGDELALEFSQAHQFAHGLKDAVIEMKEEETAQRGRREFIRQQNAKKTMKHIKARLGGDGNNSSNNFDDGPAIVNLNGMKIDASSLPLRSMNHHDNKNDKNGKSGGNHGTWIDATPKRKNNHNDEDNEDEDEDDDVALTRIKRDRNNSYGDENDEDDEDGGNSGSRSKNKNKNWNKNRKNDDSSNSSDQDVILDAEPIVSRSITDTLKFVARRGFIADEDFQSQAGVKRDKYRPIDIELKGHKEHLKWTVSKVSQWLSDNKLSKYISIFEIKRIDGRALDSMNTQQCMKVLKMESKDCALLLQKLGELKGDPAPDISLAYLDSNGNPMSYKDAFRDLSHKFHGKKPGKKKQGKRLKHQKEELLRKKRNTIDTPLGTLQKLRNTLELTRKTHVVVEGRDK